jgi:crotonobetainyl-CoA:carnitine CoA-transferase CaiB-like acyl-CoA transferase
MNPNPNGSLQGLLVVELGGSVAAPFAGQILSDLGADVVKIERPEGDDARKWGPPFADGAGAGFHSLNRGKRSVVVELRDPVQRERLLRYIVERADVVIQNLRPGQVDALGLGATTLRALKPSLIYCNLGAFGRRGPLSDRPGYDPLMQAFGGIMSVVGEPGRPPVRVGPSIIDMGTGLWSVIGILSALAKRRETGEGAVVDTSLFETSVSWMMYFVPNYILSGEITQPQGSGSPGIAPYGAFPTSDGWLVIGAGNDGLFQKLCPALGHPEWLSDARFASNALRVGHRAVLNALIAERSAQRSTAQWELTLEMAGVPCAPVQNIAQMVEHEQTRALGMIQEVAGHVNLRQVMLPLSIDDVRPEPQRGAPRLGEHTDEVLGPFSKKIS